MNAWIGSTCRNVCLGFSIPLLLVGLCSNLYAIPTNCTFEGYASGVEIQDVDEGWTVGDVGSATIVGTNYVYTGGYPEIHQTGASNVLKLAGYATNTVTGGEGAEVWVDTMISMVAWSDSPGSLPNVPSDVQAACIVNTNGNLVIYHYDHWTTLTPCWTEIPDTAVFGLTSKWARVTFRFDYTEKDNEVPTYFFQVICNGYLVTNNLASVTNHGGALAGGRNGSWFAVANSGDASLTNRVQGISVSDTGYLDDFQVTTVNPLTTTNWLIAASAGTGAAITPSGQAFVTSGGDMAFNIMTNDPNYAVTNVVVDGSTFLGVINNYTFTGVTTSHTIQVLTDIRKTANGTPFSWLAQFGLGESDDDIDIEPDGHKTWEEYVTGTDPTNAASVCKILSIELHGSSNLVSWYATTNSGVTNVFYVDRATNLMTSWTSNVSGAIPRAGDGTNKWWDTNLPPSDTIYYRPVTIWVR